MRRVLFVFSWLVVGGEETELRLLARYLDKQQYQLDVIPCFRKDNMPEQTHEQLAALGVWVDRAPYRLSFDETVAYLAERIPHYDVVVACQAVPDLYPAYERAIREGKRVPPLIEHGGLVSEALDGPKHLTARYIGVCATIRDAAASRMGDRAHHAIEIPSMVDLSEFDPKCRDAVRAEWLVAPDQFVVGWVGRLDRKKRVEDFLHAAAILHGKYGDTRFVIIGGADAFMPEYADEMRSLANHLNIADAVHFLNDRPDVPRLLSGLDAMAWLSEGEGMPHVVAEAGAARLPVVATCDNGTAEQITDQVNGLFVPHRDPIAVAAALDRLYRNRALGKKLGSALRYKVERDYSVQAIIPQWMRIFDTVIAEQRSTRLGQNTVESAAD